jgi:SAM-dependent methyltransferase
VRGGTPAKAREEAVESGDSVEPFDPEQYWEGMHLENRGFSAVGFAGLGDGFNTWMYRLRRVVVRRALRRAGLSLAGATVLDVGAGTGFYVRIWLELGADHVTGIDLSEAAVNTLRGEFPAASFIRDDIAAPSEATRSRYYDVVSAFDVLFHIVDDERFVRALKNIGDLTRAGGHLLLSDNFVHGSAIRGRNQVSRSMAEIHQALDAAGFEVVLRLPMFFLMNTPIDSRSRFLGASWRVVSGVCRRSRRAGGAVGALLFPVERLLTALVREGPSTELVVCRRR